MDKCLAYCIYMCILSLTSGIGLIIFKLTNVSFMYDIYPCHNISILWCNEFDNLRDKCLFYVNCDYSVNSTIKEFSQICYDETSLNCRQHYKNEDTVNIYVLDTNHNMAITSFILICFGLFLICGISIGIKLYRKYRSRIRIKRLERSHDLSSIYN